MNLDGLFISWWTFSIVFPSILISHGAPGAKNSLESNKFIQFLWFFRIRQYLASQFIYNLRDNKTKDTKWNTTRNCRDGIIIRDVTFKLSFGELKPLRKSMDKPQRHHSNCQKLSLVVQIWTKDGRGEGIEKINRKSESLTQIYRWLCWKFAVVNFFWDRLQPSKSECFRG